MIGLDTNVLVRYLAQDDAKQASAATRLIEKELSPSKPGFISLVVLVEVFWVLKRLYAATEPELVETVEEFLGAGQFQVEQREVVQAAVQNLKTRQGAKSGFTDLLIAELAKAHGCTQTLTFDKTAVRAAGMKLLV